MCPIKNDEIQKQKYNQSHSSAFKDKAKTQKQGGNNGKHNKTKIIIIYIISLNNNIIDIHNWTQTISSTRMKALLESWGCITNEQNYFTLRCDVYY